MSVSTPKESIILKITGFDNDKGTAYVRVRDENGKILLQEKFIIKQKLVSTKVSLVLTGKVAVDVFHDENNNGKLDTNIFGAPSEAWGISGKNRPSFRAPRLDEMLIDISQSKKIEIEVE